MDEAVVARMTIETVAGKYRHLLRAVSSQEEAEALAEEFTLRCIWRLDQSGFKAHRQRNVSGRISSDKLVLTIVGKDRAFDILSMANPETGSPASLVFVEIFPANAVPDAGIPDGAPAPVPVPPTPPVPVPNPDPPPNPGVPYDEGFYVGTVGPDMKADYKAVNRVVGDDAQWVVWPARTEHDYQNGMPLAESWVKHRAEMRAALGAPRAKSAPKAQKTARKPAKRKR